MKTQNHALRVNIICTSPHHCRRGATLGQGAQLDEAAVRRVLWLWRAPRELHQPEGPRHGPAPPRGAWGHAGAGHHLCVVTEHELVERSQQFEQAIAGGEKQTLQVGVLATTSGTRCPRYRVMLLDSMRQLDGRRILLLDSTRQLEGRRMLLLDSMRQLEGRRKLLLDIVRQLEGHKVLLLDSVRQLEGHKVPLLDSVRQLEGHKVLLLDSVRQLEGHKCATVGWAVGCVESDGSGMGRIMPGLKAAVSEAAAPATAFLRQKAHRNEVGFPEICCLGGCSLADSTQRASTALSTLPQEVKRKKGYAGHQSVCIKVRPDRQRLQEQGAQNQQFSPTQSRLLPLNLSTPNHSFCLPQDCCACNCPQDVLIIRMAAHQQAKAISFRGHACKLGRSPEASLPDVPPPLSCLSFTQQRLLCF
eukprot:scaffold78096_cov22-Tisochrysis_lutea.AAC.3